MFLKLRFAGRPWRLSHHSAFGKEFYAVRMQFAEDPGFNEILRRVMAVKAPVIILHIKVMRVMPRFVLDRNSVYVSMLILRDKSKTGVLLVAAKRRADPGFIFSGFFGLLGDKKPVGRLLGIENDQILFWIKRGPLQMFGRHSVLRDETVHGIIQIVQDPVNGFAAFRRIRTV